MLFLTPSHVKHGRQFIKDARKLVAYKRDLAAPETLVSVNAEIVALEAAVKTGDREKIGAHMKQLDEACGQLTRPVEDAGWRENVEVIVVAIVIALAVRTYFLQPFAIPTGSMFPTLNGIIVTKTAVPPPNIVSRLVQKALWWRTYYDVVAQDDESVISVEEVKRYGFFTFCDLRTTKGNTYSVRAPRSVLLDSFKLSADQKFQKGEPILRGYSDTGDHVFVDKFTYHFMHPHRDQVFVFSTRGIPDLNAPDANGDLPPSQYYIKRLGGLPGDRLRIEPPNVYINDSIPTNFGFKRVMSGTYDQPNKGYRGYGNANFARATYLRSPLETYTVPAGNYFALGDNSFNSYDSRGWGPVPQQNITGRALLVYYPFTSHFGWIW